MIKKIKAFTLSEVLIALATIGVVASLVLPQLITGHKAATAKAQFNTAYAMLAKNAADLEADNKSFGITDIQNPENIYNKLKEYNRVVIDCGLGTPSNDSVCYKNGVNTPKQTRKALGNNNTAINDEITGSFVTNNGMAIMIGSSNEDFKLPNTEIPSPLIVVDINGKDKRPNQFGYDLFAFQISLKGDITPVGSKDSFLFDKEIANYCCSQAVNPGCAADGSLNGISCALYAATDEEFFQKIYKGF